MKKKNKCTFSHIDRNWLYFQLYVGNFWSGQRSNILEYLGKVFFFIIIYFIVSTKLDLAVSASFRS